MMAAKKVSKKIVVLGDPAVGKTSLIRRFVINAFDDKYLTTIGAKIVKKEVQLRSGGAKPDIDVTLMIWDVAGQKTLGNVKQAYYRGSEGAMIVCDITRRETLLSTIDWIKTLMQVTGEIPVVLLAVSLPKTCLTLYVTSSLFVDFNFTYCEALLLLPRPIGSVGKT